MLKLSSLQPQSDDSSEPWWRGFFRWARWHLPTSIASHRILSGQLRGMKIVTSWRDYPAAIAGITEPELLDWFSRNAGAGETWLDIGAHYGFTALSLGRLVGPTGRVFAFEPMSSTVGCLARTRYANKLESITVVPLALGSVDEMRMEKLATVRGMIDSTLSANNRAVGAETWSEMILVARLDWLWPRLAGGQEKIHGIKIDVQGMEMHVLEGMEATLKTQRPKLVIEFHRGVARAPIHALLARCGYFAKATPIEPVAGETEPLFLDDRSYAFSPDNAK